MEEEIIKLCREKGIRVTIRYDQINDLFILRFEKYDKIYGHILPRSELNTISILPKTLANMIVNEAEAKLNH